MPLDHLISRYPLEVSANTGSLNEFLQLDSSRFHDKAESAKLLQFGGKLCISGSKSVSKLKDELNKDVIFVIARNQSWYPVGSISIDQELSGLRMKLL